MRYGCGELYLSDVTECQGDLFRFAVEEGYDLKDFITRYFKSDIRKNIDMNLPRYSTMIGSEILESLDKTSYKKSKYKQNPFAAEWIGCFYSLLEWNLGITSEDTLKYLPIDRLFSMYKTLHDMDMSLAVERVIKGIGEKQL